MTSGLSERWFCFPGSETDPHLTPKMKILEHQNQVFSTSCSILPLCKWWNWDRGFRNLVQKPAVPPVLLFAPHLVNYLLLEACVYKSRLMFSCLHLQYDFGRSCHMRLFQEFSNDLPKASAMDSSQTSRGAKLVLGHWPWVPGTSFLWEGCSLQKLW